MSDYDRVARAIDFIARRAGEQPSLSEVAAHVHLSPFHFQRLFARWAGVTPKRFLQLLTVEHAKMLLASSELPLLDVAHATGLSGPSRLHDHFVRLEAVTPAEYRAAGAGVTIRYGFAESPFGELFAASTSRGVCRLAFVDTRTRSPVSGLARDWPAASLREDDAEAQRIASHLFTRQGKGSEPLSLHVRGTNFQISVWRALLEIPAGCLASYRDVACAVGRPAAARAVGRAVGANPAAFAIPCHRVIRATGDLGAYRWGATRKRAIQAWEAVS